MQGDYSWSDYSSNSEKNESTKTSFASKKKESPKTHFPMKNKTECTKLLSSFLNMKLFLSIIFVAQMILLGVILVFLGSILTGISTSSKIKEASFLASEFVKTEIENWLSQGEKAISFQLDYLRTHEDSLKDLEFRGYGFSVQEMQRVLAIYVQSLHQVGHIGFGSPVGSVVFANNEEVIWTDASLKDFPCCNYSDSNQPGPHVKRTIIDRVDYSFGPMRNGSNPMKFRNKKGIWWDVGLSHDSFSWVHFLNNFGYPTDSLTHKYLDSNGTFRGVVGCFFKPSQYENTLKKLQKILPFATMWIIDLSSGLLISNNINSSLTKMGTNNKLQRLPAVESESAIISQISTNLKNNYGWKNLPNYQSVPIDTSNGIKIVSVESFNITGFELAFISSQDFEKVYSSIGFTIGLSSGIGLLLILFAVILCVIIIFFTLKPLTNLKKEMVKLQNMELDDIEIKKSAISEIKGIQESFLFSIKTIKEYRKFLPKKLLKESQEVYNEAVSSKYKTGSIYSSNFSNHSTETKPIESSIFELGLSISTKTVFFLEILYGEKQLERETEKIIALIEVIFTKILKFTRTTGILISYRIDRIVMEFTTPTQACTCALKLRNYFKNLEILKEVNPRIMMIIHKGNFFSGNIGNDEVKKSTVFGLEMDQMDFFSRSLQNLEDFDIFITKKIARCLSSKFQRSPFDLIKGKNSKIYKMYNLISNESLNVDREWMYTLSQKEYLDKFEELKRAFDKEHFKSMIEIFCEFIDSKNTIKYKIIKNHLKKLINGLERLENSGIKSISDLEFQNIRGSLIMEAQERKNDIINKNSTVLQ